MKFLNIAEIGFKYLRWTFVVNLLNNRLLLQRAHFRSLMLTSGIYANQSKWSDGRQCGSPQLQFKFLQVYFAIRQRKFQGQKLNKSWARHFRQPACLSCRFFMNGRVVHRSDGKNHSDAREISDYFKAMKEREEDEVRNIQYIMGQRRMSTITLAFIWFISYSQQNAHRLKLNDSILFPWTWKESMSFIICIKVILF